MDQYSNATRRRAFGHAIKGIRATYDDVKEYEARIDHAVQCISNEVEKIIHGTEAENVVAFRK
jgi:gamma-glutamylcysteine synthetase